VIATEQPGPVIRCVSCHGDGYVLRCPGVEGGRRRFRPRVGTPFIRSRCQDCSGTGDMSVGPGVDVDPDETVPVRCKDCDGTGEEECGECDGSGRVACPECDDGLVTKRRGEMEKPKPRTAGAKPLDAATPTSPGSGP
jgi:hypothetical protein